MAKFNMIVRAILLHLITLWQTEPFKIQSAIKRGRIEALGPKHLQIYKITLPFEATNIFLKIINAYSMAQKNAPYQDDIMNRVTSLYSLTKHDVAVVDLPGNILDLVQEIHTCIISVIQNIYHTNTIFPRKTCGSTPAACDASSELTSRSVPLHHDCCHGKYHDPCCVVIRCTQNKLIFLVSYCGCDDE